MIHDCGFKRLLQYLNTLLEHYEYMCIPVSVIPDSIMTEYNLAPLVHHDHVYIEIHKGMYGLLHAKRIANDHLTAFLAPHGYIPMLITPGLRKHTASDLVFALVIRRTRSMPIWLVLLH